MPINIRHFFAILTHLLFIEIALKLTGVYLSSVLQITSFILVLFFTLGFSFSIVGKSIFNALSFSLFRTKLKFKESEIFYALDVIEKSVFIAGIIGATTGFVHSLGRLNRLEELGPGLAVAIISFTYAIFFNAAVIVPAKISLYSENSENSSSRLSILRGREHFSFKALLSIFVALSGVLLAVFMEGGHLQDFISYPGFLLAIVAPIVSFSFYTRNISEYNYGNVFTLISNLCLSGGLLASIFQLIHLFENLDEPNIIANLAGKSLIPFLYGLIGHFFFLLRIKNKKSEFSYLPYSALVVVILAIATVSVFFLLARG